MSEYQYFEFQAVDRPLTQREMAELRALSTRATITPTRFTNVYNWGDFRGDPAVLMERYFDLHVYVANWGTHQFMLRLPRRLLDPQTAALYCVEEGAEVHAKGDLVILKFRCDDEDGYSGEEDGEDWMPALLPLRAELAGGDLRCLYLAWLLCMQSEMLDEEAVEPPLPPLPPGLGALSTAQKAFADFLRLDGDLIEVAARNSPPGDTAQPSRQQSERWIAGLADAEKNALLLRLMYDGDPHLRSELLQRLRQAQAVAPGPMAAGRTVGQLLAATVELTEAKRRAAAERAARERARRQREEAARRAAYLDDLAGREAQAWQRVDALIELKRPAEYD